MGALNDLLLQLPTILKTSGRAAFITFHSLEDRLVKNYFKGTTVEDENPFISTPKKQEFELISKKPIVPSESEIKMNSRSRSAKLRVAEKL